MTDLVCPACGYHAPIQSFTNDVDARHVAQLMGQVPPQISDLVLNYLGLFQPRKHKLTFTRARARLAPLVDAIKAGRIEFAKRQWSAPLPVWEQAMQSMVDQRAQLQLPLANHNYLFKVMVTIVNKAEATAEQQTEAHRQKGAHRIEAAPAPVIDQAAAAVELALKQARNAAHSYVQSQKRLRLPPVLAELQQDLRGLKFPEDIVLTVSKELIHD